MVTLSEAKELDDINRVKADAVMSKIDELNNAIMDATRAGLTVEVHLREGLEHDSMMPLIQGTVYFTIRYS